MSTMRVGVAAGAALVLAACGPKDQITSVSADDAKVNAAIAQAKQTLPAFWAAYDGQEPGASHYQVKAAMRTAHGGVEHIWVDVLSHSGLAVRGALANDPEDLGALKYGSSVAVDEKIISDWLYEKGGKVYGGYTIRALLDRASPDERKRVEAQLAPTPLEPKSN